MRLSKVHDIYSLEECKISFLQVHNDLLIRFAECLVSFQREVEVNYSNDEYLMEVLNFVRRIFFKFTGNFAPYNKIISDKRQEELKIKFYQIKNAYPELFSSVVIEIAKVIRELTEVNENDLVKKINDFIRNKITKSSVIAIVTKRALSPKEKKEIISDNNCVINYFTENSFRKEINVFDQVLYIGSPSYFDSYVKNTFKGRNIVFIAYEMFTNSLNVANEIAEIDNGVYSTIFNNIKIEQSTNLRTSLHIAGNENEIINMAINKIVEQQKITTKSSTELVEATIVYLENDRFLFIPIDSKIRVFFAEEKSNYIKQVDFNDINEDDYIIIRNDSDIKLIAEVADELLGSKANVYRVLQRKWKNRLRINVERKGINRVSEILSRRYNLSTASTVSIRNWCKEESICPVELPNLLRALKYNDKQVRVIYNAMKKIKSAHLKAGRLISKKLMKELSAEIPRELKEQGYYTFTSKEFNGASFNIERVVKIDTSRYYIAPYNLMKPMEIE